MPMANAYGFAIDAKSLQDFYLIGNFLLCYSQICIHATKWW